MKTKGLTALLCGILLLSFAELAIGAGMKPGLWEISTTMEMPGMPFQPPPTVIKHCYTSEEVKNNEKMVPEQDNCKITELNSSAGKISWNIVCSGEQQGSGSGEMIFKGDSAYEGKMKFQTGGMSMNSRYQGRRLGECK